MCCGLCCTTKKVQYTKDDAYFIFITLSIDISSNLCTEVTEKSERIVKSMYSFNLASIEAQICSLATLMKKVIIFIFG
jgi:hypothetical protein